jgi:hypothetical protein
VSETEEGKDPRWWGCMVDPAVLEAAARGGPVTMHKAHLMAQVGRTTCDKDNFKNAFCALLINYHDMRSSGPFQHAFKAFSHTSTVIVSRLLMLVFTPRQAAGDTCATSHLCATSYVTGQHADPIAAQQGL